MALTKTINFRDLQAGADLGTVTNPKYLFVEYNVADHERCKAVVTGPILDLIREALNSGGNVLATLTIGGPDPKARCMVTTASFDNSPPGELHIDEPGLGSVLEGALIDSITLYNTPLGQLFFTILNTPVGTDGIIDTAAWVFSGVIGAGEDLVVSEDLDTLSVLRAIELLSRRLGGQVGPDHGQYFYDSGKMILYLGQVGTGAKLTFQGNPAPSGLARDEAPLDHAFVEEPSLAGMASQVSIIGGSSDHGLPPGAQITGMAAVGDAGVGGAWPSSFVVSVYAGSTLGGVYALTDDLIFHPISQPMGVTSLYHDEMRGILYASTDRGVYENYVSAGPSIWKQTGGGTSAAPGDAGNHSTFSGKCAQASVDGLQVYAVSAGNNVGINGLLTYPAIGGHVVHGAGFDFWSMVTSTDIITGAALTNAEDTFVYLVDTTDPTVIKVKRGVFGDGSDRATTPIQIPSRYPVTKLIRVSFTTGAIPPTGPNGNQPPQTGGAGPVVAGSAGIFVLTAGGTDGFYFIDGNRPLLLLDGAGAGGLTPSTINNVQFGGNGGPALLACTSAGLYVSNVSAFNGGIEQVRWQPVSPYNALAGVNIEYAAVGRRAGRMAAANSGAFYDSFSFGSYFRDTLGANVDVLPALAPGELSNWRVYQAGQQATYVARLSQQQGPFAPGGAAAPVELAEITADANTTPEVAAAALKEAGERYLAYISTPVFTTTVNSFYRAPGLLDELRPTDQVQLAAVRPPCPGDPGRTLNTVLFVRTHSVEYDATKGDTIWTRSVLGSTLVQQKLSIEELNADILYRQSRQTRKGGRRR